MSAIGWLYQPVISAIGTLTVMIVLTHKFTVLRVERLECGTHIITFRISESITFGEDQFITVNFTSSYATRKCRWCRQFINEFIRSDGRACTVPCVGTPSGRGMPSGKGASAFAAESFLSSALSVSASLT